MKEHWTTLQEWWGHLAARERQAIRLGGMLLAIFILYQCIWSPLLTHVAFLRKEIDLQQKTLVWMQSADKAIRLLENHKKDKNKQTSPVMLLSFLQQQINQAGLQSQLSQLNQASNDTIEMHFQKVPFDSLIRLMILITKEQPVSISQFSVVADNVPGMVNADVIFHL